MTGKNVPPPPDWWGEELPLLHFVCVICRADRTVDKGKQLESGSWVCLDHLARDTATPQKRTGENGAQR